MNYRGSLDRYTAEGYGQGLFDALRELARANGQADRVQGQTLRSMETFVPEEAPKDEWINA